MARTTITFLGPLTPSTPGAKRYDKWHFLLLQSSGPLKLEYNDKDAALGARRTILSNPNTHAVPTKKLFHAIHAALSQAADSDEARRVA